MNSLQKMVIIIIYLNKYKITHQDIIVLLLSPMFTKFAKPELRQRPLYCGYGDKSNVRHLRSSAEKWRNNAQIKPRSHNMKWIELQCEQSRWDTRV